MATARPVIATSAPQARSRALIVALSHSSRRFGPHHGTPASVLKYRPLRQPQFNRLASTSSSQSSLPSGPNSRSLHSSSTSLHSGGAALGHADTTLLQSEKPDPRFPPPSPQEMPSKVPLSILPLATILRSLAVTTLSSSPFLLPPSLAIMNVLAHTTNPVLNPDQNLLLRKLMKSTFYAQFCAGENAAEVRATMARLKGLGFSGVILGYAREVVLTDKQINELQTSGLQEKDMEESVRNEVRPWADGTLETVRLAEEGDIVALKFTGAGRQALYTLSRREPPPQPLADAIDEICTLAAARGVRLFMDAEQQAVQPGIDDWSMNLMRKYNANPEKKAVIYNTYQAYLKATPSILASHLHAAREEGFTLGVKLVRGAYLGSDPRHLIHDTKADTDACYNGCAEALLRREFTSALAPFAAADGTKKTDASPSSSSAAFPEVNMVLASHNGETVRKFRTLLEAEGGIPTKDGQSTEIAFAQLQGMADEVSCEILAAKGRGVFKPRVLKYLVWGSTGECMKYLLRRAQENKDAVQRTKDGRDAMRAEVWRRLKGVFGLA